MLKKMFSTVKSKMLVDVINKKYNNHIRAVVILALIGVATNLKGDVVTLKHFDEESGVSCVLVGSVDSPKFTCESDNLIGLNLKKISPVTKTWHYKTKFGGVDISRKGYSKGIEFTATSNMFNGEKVFKMPYKNK